MAPEGQTSYLHSMKSMYGGLFRIVLAAPFPSEPTSYKSCHSITLNGCVCNCIILEHHWKLNSINCLCHPRIRVTILPDGKTLCTFISPQNIPKVPVEGRPSYVNFACQVIRPVTGMPTGALTCGVNCKGLSMKHCMKVTRHFIFYFLSLNLKQSLHLFQR